MNARELLARSTGVTIAHSSVNFRLIDGSIAA